MPDLNILKPSPTNLISPPEPVKPITPPVEMRSFYDPAATRKNIYDDVHKAASGFKPISDDNHTLRLTNVRYIDPDRFTRKQRKEAILSGGTLARRLKGTWELLDNASQQVLDSRDQVVANVPYTSSMGTMTFRGSEYTLNNQPRLDAGVFARRMNNGNIESHVNVLPGKGVSHRYFLDPARSLFKMKLGQSEMPIVPILRLLGTTDQEMRNAWGDDMFAANYEHDDGVVLKKLKQRFLNKREQEEGDDGSWNRKLIDKIQAMELNPEVTQQTLGAPYKNLSKEVILAATKKLFDIHTGKADVDDRDNLAFQTFYGPEDLLRERIERDHGRVQKDAFRKISLARSLAKMPSGLFTPQLEQALLGSGLGQAIEEINPAEVLDKQSRITRMGEGGIPSLDAIPDEARAVQPSHAGFVDPLRTPESFRVGVDLYMARNARKGRDGRVYAPFLNPQTNKEEWKSPQELYSSTVTTGDVMKWPTYNVPVLKGGKLSLQPKDSVNYVIHQYENTFSPLGNLVPFKGGVKGQRVAMASRMLTQALPLANPEAPLVRGALPEDPTRSFESEYGRHMGAVRAEKGGRVLGIQDGTMKLRYDDGTTDDVELYQHFPFNRKTFIHQTPRVQPGQTFKSGDTLVKSNYTDDEGVTALGLNARVAYIPWKGYNYEDAVVISESMARRSSSEHMYQHDVDATDKHKFGKRTYLQMYPQKFDRKTLDRLDDRGVAQVGQTVDYGDPLILAVQERDRAQNKIHKKRQSGYTDQSVVWKHHDPGVVTDVVWGKAGPRVVVKSLVPTQVGDKMSGRYGDKGVVSAIIPDAQMPHGEDGKPFEILLNSKGIISRTNPAQAVEGWLGTVARHTGKPVNGLDFQTDDELMDYAERELAKYGLKDTETLVDPTRGRKIPGIATGTRFFMKLHHTAESKGQARDSGGYSMEEAPAKGGDTGSKRNSLLDVNALMSHGATEVLRDAGAIRGQRNEDLWLQFMQGHTPYDPRVPFAYEKFIEQLKGAGINVQRNGAKTNIMAMTNKDLQLMGEDRFLRNGDTVHFDDEMRPMPGGLFDPKLTGGHGGKRWSLIRLPEPLPNPVMEEPIRRLLDLTQDKYNKLISGEHELPRFGRGPAAIAKALDNIDLDKEIETARAQIKSGRASARDQAVRKLGYLKSAKRLDLHPRDWVLDAVPVLPPAFRPVSLMGNSGLPLVSDANYLYKEMLDSVDNYKSMKDEVGEDGLGAERASMYHAFKAVTGLGDPIHPKLQEKGVKGLLKSIFGPSPKFGTVQRKLLSSTVDSVGRGVIVPNPDYDMDTVGIPENKAFTVYAKPIARRLRRRGMRLGEALRHIKEQSPLARDMLLKEMDERPVFLNRAPVLHKWGILGFRPKLVKGDVIQVSPLIVKGFNADFDGDAMQFHVPQSPEAVKEIYERMLPSKNLLSLGDFETPWHIAGQEYLGGLYHATTAKSKRRPRTFATGEDLRKAYAKGELTADEEVVVLQH